MKNTRLGLNRVRMAAAAIISCLGVLTAGATDGVWTGVTDANWATAGN